MKNKFDVYKWRREQLNESEKELSTDNKANRIYNNIKTYLDPKYQDIAYKNSITSAIIRGMSTLFTEVVMTKKIKDLTIDDVKGLTVPTKVIGVSKKINDERDLNNWREKLNQDLEVQIDTSLVWYDQVKIPGLEQIDPIGQEYMKNKNRYQGD
jgi:hypothetical protein